MLYLHQPHTVLEADDLQVEQLSRKCYSHNQNVIFLAYFGVEFPVLLKKCSMLRLRHRVLNGFSGLVYSAKFRDPAEREGWK